MSRYLSGTRLLALAGPTPLVRRLSVQSVLSAFGDGIFLTGSAVFFTRVVGLSPTQVGLGLTIAGLVAFLLSVPLGTLTDRFGAKRIWVVTALCEAAIYLGWIGVGDFAGFVAMVVLLEGFGVAGRSARNAYRFDVFPREERVSSSAYFRAARNVGYSLGALVAGIALATGSDTVVRFIPLLTAALLLLNTVLVLRLPARVAGAEGHQQAAPAQAPVAAALAADTTPGRRRDPRRALRNRGYVAMSVCNGVLNTHQVVLNVVIPLWLVDATDAPAVLLAWLFGTNTVMSVALQVATARGVTTVADALRAQRRGAAFFVLSCGIVLVTHDTAGWITIALMVIGHITVTGAELFSAAGDWGLQAELSDPERRGEYQGVSQMGYTAGNVWAPAAYTALAMGWGAGGWLVIAAIVIVAAVAIHPASHAAQRHLARVVPAATLAAGASPAPSAPTPTR